MTDAPEDTPNPDGDGGDDADLLLRLPEAIRDEFKRPLGPVFTDPDGLLAETGEPLVTVGDVVTHHLVEAGRRPHLSVVDGLTERSPTEASLRDLLEEGDRTAWNPAARLTAEALRAVREAVDAADPHTLVVDGEEDLLTLPAVLVVPDGASVVYGQPGEGMVHVAVDDETRRRARALFDRLEGDHERALAALGL